MLNLPKIYKKRSGVFYTRLIISKPLRHSNQPNKLAFSLIDVAGLKESTGMVYAHGKELVV